jgi:hypothetical protein
MFLSYHLSFSFRGRCRNGTCSICTHGVSIVVFADTRTFIQLAYIVAVVNTKTSRTYESHPMPCVPSQTLRGVGSLPSNDTIVHHCQSNIVREARTYVVPSSRTVLKPYLCAIFKVNKEIELDI